MPESSSPWILDVTEAAFDKEVLDRSFEKPVVVDFWAPWCGPCRMLGPILEKVAQQKKGDVVVAKVNIDEAQNLAATFGVEAIPAVKAFRDGKPILGFVGLRSEVQVRDFFDRILPTEADRLARQAADLEVRLPEEADTLYRLALQQEGGHEASLVGLARLALERGNTEEARQLLEPVGADGPLGQEVERLRGLLALKELAQPFGDEAAARKKLEANPQNPQLKYELGCIVAAAGKYQEALDGLLAAGESDRKLASSHVREAMVQIFNVIGVRSALSDEYRDKLSRLLY